MEMLSIEIIFIFLLLVGNGIFAMAELAIVSSRKSRLQQYAAEGDEKAKKALSIANSPSQFLSTVQIGITSVGILSGAFGGATIAEHLERDLVEAIPAFAEYAEAFSVILVVVITTYFSIIIGELVPKRLALKHPEKIASYLAGPMLAITKFARPFERILTASTDFILRIFGLSAESEEPPVTEEEVKSMVEVGTRAGVFDKDEQFILERALSLGDKKVSSIMTLKQDIVWLNVHDSIEINRKAMEGSPHSHFPVANKSLDELLGTIHTKSLYCKVPQTQSPLTEFLEPAVFVPNSSSALRVLETFKRSKIHIAFVIDEFGAIQGIVTLNDLLEAIVGDLPGNQEEADTQIVKRADDSWYIDGMLTIDRFKTFFNLSSLPNEDKNTYQTVAGFILFVLGYIPKQAATFEWENFKFEIADLDGNRIDKVIVTKTRPT